MLDNPYLGLLQVINEVPNEAKEPIFFDGIIKTPLPNLTIQIAYKNHTLDIDKDNFVMCNSLAKFKNELVKGDKVFLIRPNEKFIIIDKVVSI